MANLGLLSLVSLPQIRSLLLFFFADNSPSTCSSAWQGREAGLLRHAVHAVHSGTWSGADSGSEGLGCSLRICISTKLLIHEVQKQKEYLIFILCLIPFCSFHWKRTPHWLTAQIECKWLLTPSTFTL